MTYNILRKFLEECALYFTKLEPVASGEDRRQGYDWFRCVQPCIIFWL